MSLHYVARIERDEDYYINKNYNVTSIKTLLDDIQKAKALLSIYESKLITRYNEALMATRYIRIESTKQQNSYSSDKKVHINITVHEYYMLDGVEVYSTLIYGESKQFAYKELKNAILYIKVLLDKYKGSRYINHTPYKQMEVIL